MYYYFCNLFWVYQLSAKCCPSQRKCNHSERQSWNNFLIMFWHETFQSPKLLSLGYKSAHITCCFRCCSLLFFVLRHSLYSSLCHQCQLRDPASVLAAVCLSALAACRPRIQMHSALINTNIKYSICFFSAHLNLENGQCFIYLFFLFWLQ